MRVSFASDICKGSLNRKSALRRQGGLLWKATLARTLVAGNGVQSRGKHDLRFQYSSEVAAALKNNGAVVALESTIISHGMPYPQNLECARSVEEIIRKNGATPATIAIMDGIPHIGLESHQLEKFAQLPPGNVRKCSKRDLSVSIGLGECGATTVASTMILAKRAGIHVFVTGGIGGVHRGAFDESFGEPSLDVSADLTELGRTNIAVVCAGIKSILDIPRTLEYLETEGVSVITLGQKEFPAFFTRNSGVNSPCTLNDVEDIASILHANTSVLELDSGLLVAVPNPNPMDQTQHDELIKQALSEASCKGIHGKESTPFLLKRLNELTHGSSLESNIALVKNNAEVGAKLAVHFKRLRSQGVLLKGSESKISDAYLNRILVVGGAAIDIIASPLEGPQFYTSNPGKIYEAKGGVGRNIAECVANLQAWSQASKAVHRRPVETSLLTAVGNDSRGRSILDNCQSIGIDTSLIRMFEDERTSTYCSVTDSKGNLLVSIADMDVFDHLSSVQHDDAFNNYELYVVDGNMPTSLIERTARLASAAGKAVIFEPVSVPKSLRGIDVLQHLDIITPNHDEVTGMAESVKGSKRYAGGSVEEDARLVAMQMHVPGRNKFVLVTMGSEGVLEVVAQADGTIMVRHHPAITVPPNDIVSSNGCGDTFAGALAWSLLVRRKCETVPAELQQDIENHIRFATEASACALTTLDSVPKEFPLVRDI